MITIGIMLAFGAATAQSVSYILSRIYVSRMPGGSLQLLVLSHIIQGLFSIPLLLAVWPQDMPPLREYFWPLAGDVLFYLAGQAGLFYALRHTDASRVSPLLGTKVVLLAVLTVLVLSLRLTMMQWVAVAIACVAAFVLNYTGGALKPRALLGVSIAVIGYSLSDVCIQLLFDAVHPVTGTPRVLVAVGLAYFCCGLIGVALLPIAGSRRWQVWRDACPYAITWMLSMVFLYGSFAVVGVLLANIVQSSRGVISVTLGAMVAHWGFVHLETRTTRGVLVRRMAAAVLMCLAIALYVISATRDTTTDATQPGLAPAPAVAPAAPTPPVTD